MRLLINLLLAIGLSLLLFGCSGDGTSVAHADEWDSVEVMGFEIIDLPVTTYIYSVCIEYHVWVLTVQDDSFTMQQMDSGGGSVPCSP